VWVGAAFYAGLTLLVTWQALRNESIVAPGTMTLIVAVGLAAATAVMTLLVAAPPVRARRMAKAM